MSRSTVLARIRGRSGQPMPSTDEPCGRGARRDLGVGVPLAVGLVTAAIATSRPPRLLPFSGQLRSATRRAGPATARSTTPTLERPWRGPAGPRGPASSRAPSRMPAPASATVSSLKASRAMLSFERPGDRAVAGRVPLKYFVGSNTRGRTFLFAIDRFLYQSPINYYARARTWDMSPGYADLTTVPLNHVVDQTCLFCHASQVAMPETGTTNRFKGEAFGQNGVGCERCHGPGSDHAAGHGDMIDPGSAGARRPRQHLHAVPSRRAGENRARRTDADRLPTRRAPGRLDDRVRVRQCRQRRTGRRQPRRVAGRERLQAEERRPDVVPVLSQSARPAGTGRARRVRSRPVPPVPRDACGTSSPGSARLRGVSHAARGQRRHRSHGRHRPPDPA